MYAYLLYIQPNSMNTLYKWVPSRMPALFPGRDLAKVLAYSKYRGEGGGSDDPGPAGAGGNLSQPDVPASNVFTTP